MRKFLIAVALMSAAWCLDLTPPAAAQSVQEQMQASAIWGQQFTQIVSQTVGPMQRIPVAPAAEQMNRQQRRAWANEARAWSANTRAAYVAVHSSYAALSSPPPSGSAALDAALTNARTKLGDVITAADAIAEQYVTIGNAVERGDTDALLRARAAAIDSTILIADLFQNTNQMQADALVDAHPQRGLMRSYADFYDGFATVLRYKRSLLSDAPLSRVETSDGLLGIAARMRADVAGGQVDRQSLLQSLSRPDALAPSEAALLPRLRAMLETYDQSFARELRLAAEFDAMAVLLRDQRDFAVIEPEFDQHLDVMGQLDAERIADGQRRRAFMIQTQ